jgi:hypothetical protein
MLFLKLAARARKLPLPWWAAAGVNKAVGGANAKEVAAVEDFFKEIKNTLLYDVANLGLDLYLVVWGDVYFTHQFQPLRSGYQGAVELLTKVANAELGEQVVINLCRCLQDYRLEVIMKDLRDLWLYVKIDL